MDEEYYEEDVYDDTEDLVADAEISSTEAAFMKGYNDADDIDKPVEILEDEEE